MSEKMIDRTGARALMDDDVAREIISGVRKQSVALSLMKKLPNMSTGVQKQPVLSMLPMVDFVNGDAGLKVTTEAAWDKKEMVVGEIAGVIPIPQAVLDDSSYDIWGEVRPLIEESMARKFDNAVLSVRNPKAPLEWPDPIIVGAKAAGNVVTAGTGTDIGDDISLAMAILEEDEYDITGIAAQKRLRTRLRGLRNSNGDPIYVPMTGGVPDTIYNTPTRYISKGTWDRNAALALMGDWTLAAYAFRQDITYQIFDTGVINDDEGLVKYNLLTQDMVAMRCVMRIAFQIANPIDIDRPYENGQPSGYPFAILAPEPGPDSDPDPDPEPGQQGG